MFQNLTPGMTAMANMVSARAKELTFQIHRELLEKHLDSVKSMVPLLVSAIKITVTTISQGKHRRVSDYTVSQCIGSLPYFRSLVRVNIVWSQIELA